MELMGRVVGPVSVTATLWQRCRPSRAVDRDRCFPEGKGAVTGPFPSSNNIFGTGLFLSDSGHSGITARYVAFSCDETALALPPFLKEKGRAMMERFKPPLPERLAQEAERLRAEAELLPHGEKRGQLLQQLRQIETGPQMSAWLGSPSLRPPT